MINLIIGILILISFCYILYECLKEKRNRKIWVINSLNLGLAIINIYFFAISIY
jgi:hypothetical protein